MAKSATYQHAWLTLAVTRIALGFIFLWAFFDKTFGLGYATPAARAWVNGGSPTTGFLKGVEGPFASFFNGLAGNAFIDWVFMLGLLGIGLALILGIGLRVAAISGTAMLVMMWMAAMPMTTNPVLDDHLIYALVLWVVAFGRRELSLFDWWASKPAVKKQPWLW